MIARVILFIALVQEKLNRMKLYKGDCLIESDKIESGSVDLTMGSGSTGVACKDTNRDFIGIEMNDDYFKIAEQRINGTML